MMTRDSSLACAARSTCSHGSAGGKIPSQPEQNRAEQNILLGLSCQYKHKKHTHIAELVCVGALNMPPRGNKYSPVCFSREL